MLCANSRNVQAQANQPGCIDDEQTKKDEKRPAAYHIVHRMKATYCMVRWTANGTKERARAFSLAGCKECRNPKAKWQKNKEIVVRST